jgi:hypothetical protein
VLIVICHGLPLQGFFHLSQLLLTLGQVPGKPSIDTLGLQLLDPLPLKIALEGVDLLLGAITFSPGLVALPVKPRLGLVRVVSLLAEPLGHRDILASLCL